MPFTLTINGAVYEVDAERRRLCYGSCVTTSA